MVASVPPAPHPPIKGLPIPTSFPPIPLKSGRSSCCPASLRLVSGLPDPNLPPYSKIPMSISSPKCQCQSSRQNANVNILAKLPMSIPLPKCTIHEPLTPSLSRRPREGLIQNFPTLGIRPLYLLGPRLEVLQDCH